MDTAKDTSHTDQSDSARKSARKCDYRTECRTCGASLGEPARTGRPREYCTRECRLLPAMLVQLEELLVSVAHRMDTPRVLALKSRFRQMENANLNRAFPKRR